MVRFHFAQQGTLFVFVLFLGHALAHGSVLQNQRRLTVIVEILLLILFQLILQFLSLFQFVNVL